MTLTPEKIEAALAELEQLRAKSQWKPVMRRLIHQLEMAYEGNDDAADAYGVTDDLKAARALLPTPPKDVV